MARVTPLQVARWVIEAGFSAGDAVTATAVGIASGADPNATGGVFGIGGPSGDGLGQAKTALQVVRDKGWSGLPAYHSGHHVMFIPAAIAAVAAASAVIVADKGEIPNPAGAISDAAGEVKKLVDTVTAPIRSLAYLGTTEAQQRVAKFMIGAALIVVGGMIFAGSGITRAGRKILGSADEAADSALAIRASQASFWGRGARGLNAAAGAVTTAAPRRPEPKPAPSPPAPETATTELSEVVANTRRILGAEEARAKGIAPTRGVAKRPAAKLPGTAEAPKRRRRAS